MHAFLWEYSDKRLQLAQLPGRLGVFLTCAAAARAVASSPAPPSDPQMISSGGRARRRSFDMECSICSTRYARHGFHTFHGEARFGISPEWPGPLQCPRGRHGTDGRGDDYPDPAPGWPGPRQSLEGRRALGVRQRVEGDLTRWPGRIASSEREKEGERGMGARYVRGSGMKLPFIHRSNLRG
jgi:hypothetical protein